MKRKEIVVVLVIFFNRKTKEIDGPPFVSEKQSISLPPLHTILIFECFPHAHSTSFDNKI